MMRGGKMVTVEIHFDEFQPQWIRERQFFHPDEQRDDLPDGSLRLKFKVGEQGLEAVARDLSNDDSIKLQSRGIGGRRAMGCGIFNPILVDSGNKNEF